jgi:hypothetical protein
MNTRASGSPPWRRLAPTILLAVAALAFPGTSARAECGSHGDRPTLPLKWAKAEVPIDRAAPPDRVPTCSGLDCSRTSLPPIASPSKPLPRLDLCDSTTPEPLPGFQGDSWVDRSEKFNPIGRVTEIERPPCRSSSAE